MTIKKNAPVLLFAYLRLEHLQRVIAALLKNPEAAETELIVFSDGPKSPDQCDKISAIRAYVNQLTGFKSVRLMPRETNFGLAKSIIDGVSFALTKYETVIVLEDDIVVSPTFLDFMNNSLELLAERSDIISIHGYLYPIDEKPAGPFLMRGADCWGWATWRRGWKIFEPDGRKLLDELVAQKLLYEFDHNGTAAYSSMLKENIDGQNDSWAVRWHASAFLKNKYTLYPPFSLVDNIGRDGSGTHSGRDKSHDVSLSAQRVHLSHEIAPASVGIKRSFERFFARTQRRSVFARASNWILKKCLPS